MAQRVVSTLTLSDEPAREPDDLAAFVAWAILGAFGAWAAWGWLCDGVNALTLLLAVVFGLFQIATNILAVKVRELASRGAFVTMTAAFVAMIATGLLTHESLNHAYAVTQRVGIATADPRLMSWLLLMVPYLEPLMFWINRLLTEPERPQRPILAMGLFPLLALLLFGPGRAEADEPPPPPKPITEVMPKAAHKRITDPVRAQADLLLRQGMGPTAVQRATGLSLSTVKRMARALAESQSQGRSGRPSAPM